MPLNSPRSSRVTAVSVAARVSRSIPQPHANSQMAPTIRNARVPRSRAAASTLGGPLVSAAPGGVRRWSTDRSTTLTAAGRVAATANSQNAFMAPNTHRSQNAANSMDTPSVMFRARSRRASPDRKALVAATARPCEREQHETERISDRRAHGSVDVEIPQHLHGDPAAEKPAQQNGAPSRPVPAAASSTGKTRRRRLWAKKELRQTPQSRSPR